MSGCYRKASVCITFDTLQKKNKTKKQTKARLGNNTGDLTVKDHRQADAEPSNIKEAQQKYSLGTVSK
ncbi:MAG: hypothetical protein AB2693_26920 [Candidatus Thiodiazotropha sp.]